MASTYILCEECADPVEWDTSVDVPFICPRCDHKTHRYRDKSVAMTVAFSLTALILYFPANFFPFMTMELYGSRSSPTIWQGVLDLMESGSWFIAGVVFLASIVLPLLKLVVLFSLSVSAKKSKWSLFKTKLFRVTESIGRWSMLDIFLLAILVAVMKLGPWTSVEPEVGSVLFALVVVFTMLASATFDVRLLWSDEDEKKDEVGEA